MTTTPDKIWLIDMDGDEFFRDYVWCDCPNPSPGMEESDATEYIRADLLQDPEWLAANGLMVKPEKCEQCDNSGEVERFVVCSDMECLTCDIGGTAENQCPITEPCPCTKNPNSLYNFIKNGE